MDIIQRAREQIKRRYIEATDHEQNAYESMLKLIGLNEELTAEVERLQRVVEQAIEFGAFTIVHVGAGEYEIKRPDIDNWGKESDYPDLFPVVVGADL